ncbi:MAG: hypothetical protein U1E78_08290 [Gammaproteobacteria bacterium]
MLYENIDIVEVDALKKRLIEIINRFEDEPNLPTSLNGRISLSDYAEILKYLKSYDFHKIEKIPKRFDKQETNLTRTLNLEFDYVTQEYSLFLETKSKQSSNQKVEQRKIQGGYKSGKSSFRLDRQQIEYINLTFYFNENSENHKKMIQSEVEIPRSIFSYWQSQGIPDNQIPIVVPSYSASRSKFKIHKGARFQDRINFHAPMATTDLIDFIMSTTFTQRYALDFSYQILNLFQMVYGAGVIHQDFKPDNILLYKVSEDQFQLKLTDFSYALKSSTRETHFAKSSRYYASPELIGYYGIPKKGVSPYAFSLSGVYQRGDKSLGAPHWANDAWAVATTIYMVLYGDFPSDPSNLDWLKRLFADTRQDRPTPEKALEDFSNYYHLSYERHRGRLISFNDLIKSSSVLNSEQSSQEQNQTRSCTFTR